MIRLSNIRKVFQDKTVIEDFSYTFEDGKIYQIEGDSGIGKTTLLRILMGLEKPTSGEIVYQDTSTTFAPVFQESRLIEDQNSILNIQVVNRKLNRDVIVKTLEEILPEDCLQKPVTELSGGMRRRVEIVRSLLSDHSILIMDEPFASLDKETIDAVTGFILEHRNGRTWILISHTPVDIPGIIRISIHGSVSLQRV